MAVKKKTTSTGSPTLDALTAAKKFKAPKDYKPLSTKEKLGMVATAIGPGKVVKGVKALKTVSKVAKSTSNRAYSVAPKKAIPKSIWEDNVKLIDKNGNKIVNRKEATLVFKGTQKEYAKGNARGLKAANKPTKASKTFEGNNKKISVEVRRGALKNEKPARPNRERGGSLNTLRRQGRTGK